MSYSHAIHYFLVYSQERSCIKYKQILSSITFSKTSFCSPIWMFSPWVPSPQLHNCNWQSFMPILMISRLNSQLIVTTHVSHLDYSHQILQMEAAGYLHIFRGIQGRIFIVSIRFLLFILQSIICFA